MTFEDIHQHLMATGEGLTSISRAKVYNLMQPAKSSSIEATRHKNAVDIRVGTKQCDISRETNKPMNILRPYFCLPTSIGGDTGKSFYAEIHIFVKYYEMRSK